MLSVIVPCTAGEWGPARRVDDRTGAEWTTVDLKKVGIIVGVIFALFFVISQPQGSANFVLNILYILRDAGNAVVQFLGALF
jgi:hypothetical protein